MLTLGGGGGTKIPNTSTIGAIIPDVVMLPDGNFEFLGFLKQHFLGSETSSKEKL
jgi:hypothetical protein